MEQQLTHLTIKGDDGTQITARYNPNKLVLAKSISWEEQNAKERDVPELQFKNGQPRSLSIDLLFDTYDTPNETKESVRKYTDEVLKLALVNGDKHRPPVCELSWGANNKDFFKGVLEKLDQEFTLFMKDGTPVRATCKCSFKEWRTNQEDKQKQNKKSSDVAKVWTVKRGDTIDGIAAAVYLDARLWRPIADANDLEDPHHLVPGTLLSIPTVMFGFKSRRF